MKLAQTWKYDIETSIRRWKLLSAAAGLMGCAPVWAETFIVENTSQYYEFGKGMNFEEAVAAANDNAGPDIILFSNQSSRIPGESGYSGRCFNFDDPVVISDTIQVVGIDELANSQLDELGQLIPVRNACLSYTGEGTAITFDENAAGSDFRVDALLGAGQAFQLCALSLNLEAWLSDFDAALGLCETAPVEADAKLIVANQPGGVTILDADLPTDANLDLHISTTIGPINDGPLLVNLSASECGGKVRLSGNDIRGGLQVDVKGCVDLLVDQFRSDSLYNEGIHLPWLTASSWSPEAVELTPSIRIQNSLLANVTASAGEPLITLDGAELSVAHSTLTANNTALREIIRMANTDFVADHSIIAGNDAAALAATSSSIELIYSMVDSASLVASSLVADGVSEAWLLNSTQPQLEDMGFMPSLSSLALNAGDSALAMGVGETPLQDLTGQQRIIDGAIDLGALERNFGPVFDESGASAELVRQRRTGNSELTLDLERYISDPEGDAFDVDFVVAQQGVTYREDLGQLFVPATATGLLAWVAMKDGHGRSSIGFVNAESSSSSSSKAVVSTDSGGAIALGLLALLLTARRKPSPLV